MWIRTKDNERLVNVNSLYVTTKSISDEEGQVIDADTNLVLGYYETAEKAKKVLDMLEAHINSGGNKGYVFDMPEDF